MVPKWQFCPKSVFLTYQTLRGKTEIRNSRFQAYENIFSFNYQRNKYAKILILKLAGSLKLTFTVTKSKKLINGGGGEERGGGGGMRAWGGGEGEGVGRWNGGGESFRHTTPIRIKSCSEGMTRVPKYPPTSLKCPTTSRPCRNLF